MTNLSAVKSLCNAIANTFYPDDATIELALFIPAQGEATPKDPETFRVAVALVMGYVESSRSENGVSTSVMADAAKESIRYWCNIYGLDADEVLGDYVRVIDNGTHYW